MSMSQRRCSGAFGAMIMGLVIAVGCSHEQAPPKAVEKSPPTRRPNDSTVTAAHEQPGTTDSGVVQTAATQPVKSKGYNPARHTTPTAPKEIIQLSAEMPDDAPPSLPK